MKKDKITINIIKHFKNELNIIDKDILNHIIDNAVIVCNNGFQCQKFNLKGMHIGFYDIDDTTSNEIKNELFEMK